MTNIDSYAGAILAIASFGILAVWTLGLCRCGNDQHRSLPGNLAPDRDRARFDADIEAQRTPGMGDLSNVTEINRKLREEWR